MLDIHFIRENAEIVKAGAAKKHIEVDIDKLIMVDDTRKMLRLELDTKRAEQNRRSNEIQYAKGEDRTKLIEAMTHLKNGMTESEERLKIVMGDWQRLMLAVPNVPDMSVPDGESDIDNKEVKLSDFKGKAVMLRFWSSRCPSCKKEMPVVEQHNSLSGNDIGRLKIRLGKTYAYQRKDGNYFCS